MPFLPDSANAVHIGDLGLFELPEGLAVTSEDSARRADEEGGRIPKP
jgi:hypothetical protein